jgi:transcription antitermination protein NusB
MDTKLTDLPDFNEEDVEIIEVIEHPEALNERSTARRLALQVLYEIDATKHPFAEVIAVRLQEQPVRKKAERYLRRLVKGVADHAAALDMIIKQYATEWPLQQVSIVDRNILRLALYELALRPEVSASVMIKEAVELADLFGAEGSSGFINGVLGALVDADPSVIRQILPPEPKNGS